jgi:putative nucleotidyltransferase with HDIG domain
MSIPSREQAAAVLLELDPSPRLLRHVTAVAEIAAFLAERAAQRGHPVDRRLVESAALLHDVDKAVPGPDPSHRLSHGDAGAAWLTERGFAELAPLVAAHPVSRLGDEAAYERFSRDATLEARIVAYADKRAAQRLQPIGERFRRWRRRHPELKEPLKRARKRAALLEAEVCAAADVDPQKVRRLRWVAAARARARTTGAHAVTAGAR